MLGSELSQVFSSLHPRGRLKVLVTLELYLDESGWTGQSVCVMAGYIASSRQWVKFINEWQNVRNNYSAPPFHARRFFNPQAFKHDYPNWTRRRGWEYLSKLIGVARKYRMREINGAMKASLFYSLSLEQRRFLTGAQLKLVERNSTVINSKWVKSGAPSKAYYTCLITCIFRALDNVPPHLILHLYMDGQRQLAPYAVIIYAQFKREFKDTHKLGGIVFSNREKSPVLQLADMIAYLRFQEATNALTVEEENALAGLVEKRRDCLAYVEKKTIDAIFRAQAAPTRKFLET